MAYQIHVLDCIRSRPTGVTISYELLSDGARIDTGSVGLEFPSATLTATQRRQAMRQSLTGIFDGIIERAETGDADFDAVQAALADMRYP